MDDDKVKSAQVVLGHVAPTPWVSSQAAKKISGKRIDERSATDAGEEAIKGAKPLGRNRYKIQLARVAVKRALLRASGKEV